MYHQNTSQVCPRVLHNPAEQIQCEGAHLLLQPAHALLVLRELPWMRLKPLQASLLVEEAQ